MMVVQAPTTNSAWVFSPPFSPSEVSRRVPRRETNGASKEATFLLHDFLKGER